MKAIFCKLIYILILGLGLLAPAQSIAGGTGRPVLKKDKPGNIAEFNIQIPKYLYGRGLFTLPLSFYRITDYQIELLKKSDNQITYLTKKNGMSFEQTDEPVWIPRSDLSGRQIRFFGLAPGAEYEIRYRTRDLGKAELFQISEDSNSRSFTTSADRLTGTLDPSFGEERNGFAGAEVIEGDEIPGYNWSKSILAPYTDNKYIVTAFKDSRYSDPENAQPQYRVDQFDKDGNRLDPNNGLYYIGSRILEAYAEISRTEIHHLRIDWNKSFVNALGETWVFAQAYQEEWESNYQYYIFKVNSLGQLVPFKNGEKFINYDGWEFTTLSVTPAFGGAIVYIAGHWHKNDENHSIRFVRKFNAAGNMDSNFGENGVLSIGEHIARY